MTKWVSIGLLAKCEVLALGLWFSISATVPALRQEFVLSDGQVAILTGSVAVGFVAGTLSSAILGLADRLPPRRFFMVSAFLGAAANLAVYEALMDPGDTLMGMDLFQGGHLSGHDGGPEARSEQRSLQA